MSRSVLVALLILTCALSVAVSSIGGCGVTNTKPGAAVIDCLTADRTKLDGLSGELGPLAFGEKPDWSTIYTRAKNAGKVIGGCVLSELVQKYLGGKKATEADESWKARDALERFRKEVAGGATFRTSAGDL